MIKKILFTVISLISYASFSQVVINELDADTSGADFSEFIELKSTTPFFNLNGYVLVFYNGLTNGTGNLSYMAFDLDGYTTDVNGIIHFGNSLVSPTPAGILGNSSIQNGPDVVAIHLGNDTDYPYNSVANASGLVDAIAYSNSATTQPTTLMTVFGITVCTNENQTSQAPTKSIQRNNNGTYTVATPTPGVNNDGSGVIFNYISVATNVTSLIEGETLLITFSTSSNVTNQPLTINFTLNNGSFNSSDYTGTTSATIPVGNNSVTVPIQMVNDMFNDGDEEAKIVANEQGTGYALNNNNVIVRVNDINFVVRPFGTPLSPTYGNVLASAPLGYYDSLMGLSGNNLKQAIQAIIANPSVVRAHNYGDVANMLRDCDQNPANSNQVWLMYVEQPRSKLDYQDSNSNIGKWNREHIYPQSRGGFSNGTSDFADGINIWLPTNADDILAGHADAHHIRAEDGPENSLRSNKDYGLTGYNGPTGNVGSWKGDVARSLFYMAVRYNALDVVNGDLPDTTVGQIGDLASLLQWYRNDPADDFEMFRNNYIYIWQVNRNPFIDLPTLAEYIWGNKQGQVWNGPLSNSITNEVSFLMYPNPTNDNVTISGTQGDFQAELYSISGAKIQTYYGNGTTRLPLSLSSGMYLLKITSEGKSELKKLIIN